TQPPAAGVASRTPRQPHRVSPLWDMLFPREREPPSVHPCPAYPGAPRHAVAASEAFCVPRVPASPLGNEWNLRRADEVDAAPLPAGTRGMLAGVSVQRTGPSLWSLRTH